MGLYDDAHLSTLIPVPASDAHKYSRGKAVVVAGSARYPGAACLAAHASQLAGAGYTQVFTALPNVSRIQAYRPSLVVSPFDAFDPEGAVGPNGSGAVAIGPGFAPDPALEPLVKNAIKRVKAPLLIDGGALGFLAKPKYHACLAKRRAKGRSCVLTPHEGEAARLGASYGIVLAEPSSVDARRAFAGALAECYESIVVLKGPVTIVAAPDQDHEAHVVDSGTAALAKAGTGDVLAGLIGGLLAQGVEPFDAAVLGASLHAHAGCVAQGTYGIVSVCAEEVLASIPRAIMDFLALRSA